MIVKIAAREKSEKTYLIKEKEACLVATSEIDDEHGISRYIGIFTNNLQQVIHDIGKQSIGNNIQPKSAQSYSHRVIKRVNR